jgi:hypothetical protein
MRIGGLIKTVRNNLGISIRVVMALVRVREREMSRAYKPFTVKSWQVVYC